jgi:hypothetical protein
MAHVFTFVVSIFGFAAFFAPPTYAVVPLPWATTYDCPEQQAPSPTLNCDGMSWYGGWTTSNGNSEQITSAANYLAGGAGRGQRHWIGDGINNTSGGTRISFPSTNEFWIRFYVRYQQGFGWNTTASSINHKIIYPIAVSHSGNWYAFGFIENMFGIQTNGNNIKSTTSWSDIFGAQSDGTWHAMEFHVKANTATGTNDGVAEGWLDGVLQFSVQNRNFDPYRAWDYLVIGENHRTPANGADMYVDIDDVAISVTGPIGPAGPIDTLAPAAPSNLTVQ